MKKIKGSEYNKLFNQLNNAGSLLHFDLGSVVYAKLYNNLASHLYDHVYTQLNTQLQNQPLV